MNVSENISIIFYLTNVFLCVKIIWSEKSYPLSNGRRYVDCFKKNMHFTVFGRNF